MVTSLDPQRRAQAQAPDLSERQKVVALVFNSVSHDTRVLKEASSLAEAGLDMTILGIRDNRAPAHSEAYPNGVKVRRMDTRIAARFLKRCTHTALAALVLFSYIAFLNVDGGLFASPIAVNVLAAIVLTAIPAAILLLRGINRTATAAALLFILCYLVTFQLAPADATHPQLLMLTLKAYPALVMSLILTALVLEMVPMAWPFDRDQEQEPETIPRPRPPISSLFKESPSVLRRFSGDIVLTLLALRHLQRLRPAIIHCHDMPTLPAGVIYSKLAGVPVVYDSHEIFTEQSTLQTKPFMQSYYAIIERICAPHVRRFITINDSIATYLTSRYPQFSPATIVKNAAIWDGNRAPYDGRLHEAANLSPDDDILLYQGGFSPHRGLETLVQAGETLPPGWFIVMMGWGKLEEHLHQLVSTAEQEEYVRFVPGVPQQELRQWTAGATIGIVPYPNTGLNHQFCTPNKLWEYPSAGVPILATPLAELATTITRHGIGWLLPTTDPEPADIGRIISDIDVEQLAAAREACFRFLEEDNWSIYAERLQHLYLRLAAAPR